MSAPAGQRSSRRISSRKGSRSSRWWSERATEHSRLSGDGRRFNSSRLQPRLHPGITQEAAGFEETDWPQILAFYQLLERLSDNPIVSLNRIVATAMVEGPKAGLDALDVLAADARLKGHYRLDAVRAHLLEKAGDREAAVAHYRKAAARTSSVPERNYLVTRAARLA
jgi:predicted RNA polymerase sigma factor